MGSSTGGTSEPVAPVQHGGLLAWSQAASPPLPTAKLVGPIVVGDIDGDGKLDVVTAGTTSHPLYSAQAEQVKLAIPLSAASVVTAAETFSVEIVLDAKWHACRMDNNSASLRDIPCNVIF